jgi:hypothetical protein
MYNAIILHYVSVDTIDNNIGTTHETAMVVEDGQMKQTCRGALSLFQVRGSSRVDHHSSSPSHTPRVAGRRSGSATSHQTKRRRGFMRSLKRERSCVQLPLLPIDERRPFTWHEKISWNSASTDDADSLSGESFSEDQTSSEFDDALIDSLGSQAASDSLFDSPVSKKPAGLVFADGTSRDSRHGSPTCPIRRRSVGEAICSGSDDFSSSSFASGAPNCSISKSPICPVRRQSIEVDLRSRVVEPAKAQDFNQSTCCASR